MSPMLHPHPFLGFDVCQSRCPSPVTLPTTHWDLSIIL